MYRSEKPEAQLTKGQLIHKKAKSTASTATDVPKFPSRRPSVSQGSAAILGMESASAVQLKLDDLLMILTGSTDPASPHDWGLQH